MTTCPNCSHIFAAQVEVDKLTTAEILQYIDEADYSWYELRDGEYPVDGLGIVKSVFAFGGGEGSGEEMWCVIQVGSRLFRKDGYYRSWDGDNWDGPFREVTAKPKTITVYE